MSLNEQILDALNTAIAYHLESGYRNTDANEALCKLLHVKARLTGKAEDYERAGDAYVAQK